MMMTAHKNVYTALAAAQAEMGPLIKGNTNPAFKSKYADLADLTGAVRDPLTRNGLAYFHQIIRQDGALDMRTSLVHGETDTRIDCDVPLIVAKNDMQGMKSATTYAKRIGLESVTGVAPEDDDGNAAVKAAPATEPRQTAKPATDLSATKAAIANAETGRDLLAAIKGIDDTSAIRPQIVDKLMDVIARAPSLAALDALQKTFAPEWADVAAEADVRRFELTPVKDDLGGDELPY